MNDIITRPAPAVALGEALLKMLADPQIPAEKIKMLLEAQMAIMADTRREEFQAAFAKMYPRMPRVDKRGLVRLEKDGRLLGTYRYAKWEDMDLVVRPIMSEFGFSLTFYQRIDAGKAVLVGKLMHASGHSEVSEKLINPDPGPGRNAAQAEGSGTTYAKRYLGEGLLNIIREGVDDDGIAAGLTPISDSQVKELTKLLKDTGSDHLIFLNMMVSGVEKIENIPARDFVRLVNALNQKREAQLRQPKEKK